MRQIDSKECYSSFGKFIKQARVLQGLGQVELSEKCGISQSNLSRIEAGGRIVEFSLAIRLCEALNLDIKEFIDELLQK